MKQPVLYSASLVVIMALLYAVGLFDKQKDPNEVTLSEFKKRTENPDKTVLVYFHADWCAVCHKMKPLIHKVDSLYKPKLEILDIDTDRDKQVAEEFNVNTLPILMLYKGGTCQWVYVGVLTERELLSKLSRYGFSQETLK